MYKTHTKRHGNHRIDLHNDIDKIKAALLDTTIDLRGKAGEMLQDSLESVRERSAKIQDDVTAYTTERPIKSLSIALIAGLAVGYLLGRK